MAHRSRQNIAGYIYLNDIVYGHSSFLGGRGAPQERELGKYRGKGPHLKI